MPLIKKIKVGSEAVEIDRIVRSIRKELALRSLTYLNPSVVRGLLAQEVKDKVALMTRKIMITRKVRKLGSSMIGRSYINNIVISIAKRYAGEQRRTVLEIPELGRLEIGATVNHKLKMLRRELKNLYRDGNIKGIEYVQRVREIVHKYFDSKTAYKIDKELMIRINMAELGKKGVLDFIDGRTFYRSKDKPINFANAPVEKGMELAGIRKTKKDYYELKVARLMVQALQSSKSPENAVTKFLELYEKEKVADSVFRDAEFKGAFSFLVGMYNMSTVASAVEKTITLLPRKLLTVMSRLLASAYRMIPIVGGIGATNVEVAEAVSELGESLSARIENSAYMPIDLRMIMGDQYTAISDVLQKRIIEETRRRQVAS